MLLELSQCVDGFVNHQNGGYNRKYFEQGCYLLLLDSESANHIWQSEKVNRITRLYSSSIDAARQGVVSWVVVHPLDGLNISASAVWA